MKAKDDFFQHVTSIRELAELGHSNKESGRQLFAGTDARPAIMFPPVGTAQWEEQVQIYMELYVPVAPLMM